MPPRNVDIYLRIATDGKRPLCQPSSPAGGLPVLPAGLSCLSVVRGAGCLLGVGRHFAMSLFTATAVGELDAKMPLQTLSVKGFCLLPNPLGLQLPDDVPGGIRRAVATGATAAVSCAKSLSGLSAPPSGGIVANPGQNTSFVHWRAVNRAACQAGLLAMRRRHFVTHWIHVSIFFPQQNVRRT